MSFGTGTNLSSPLEQSEPSIEVSLTDLNSAIKENPSEKEIAPLFLFLASSLNVELVYIILKGISHFAYL